MAKYEKGQLVSVPKYAKLCDVTPQAIYARIDAGEIEPVQIEETSSQQMFVDIKLYPPKKSEATWAKSKGGNTKLLIAYVKATAEELKSKKVSSPDEFQEFLKEKHKAVKKNIEFEYFVRMLKEFK